MTSTLTAATLTVTITEAVTLNGYDQGSKNELTISSINELMKRIVIILAVFYAVIYSQEFYGSGAFTEIGFSARSLSLGNTMFSDNNPAVAIYFNPAVITNRNKRSVHINYRSNNTFFGNLIGTFQNSWLRAFVKISIIKL